MINDLLDVVARYGSPDEINAKAAEAGKLENLLRRLDERSVARAVRVCAAAGRGIVATIGGFDGSNDEDDKGIWIANSTVNTTVSSNKIADLIYTGTGGYASHGIYVSAATASAMRPRRGRSLGPRGLRADHLRGD